MAIYKKLTQSDQTNKEGGYKNIVFFAPTEDFTLIKNPSTNLDLLGGPVTITESHTFPTDKGFFSMLTKKHSVTTKATSTGEDGAKSLVHTAEFIVLGDSNTTLHQMKQLLNQEAIWLVKDQDCLNATDYVQFGDGCLQPDVTVEFDGKTTKEGLKEYKVTLSVKEKKFFYQGTVTEATSYVLSQVDGLIITGIGATSLTLNWNTQVAATSYTVQRAASSAFNSPTSTSVTSLPHNVTGLTTATTYWFRVRAVNAQGVGPWSDPVAVQTV